MTTNTEPFYAVKDADLTTARRLAQSLANTIKTPVSVVAEDEHYFIRDNADLACYGGRGAIVATYQPLAIDPPAPEPNPLGDTEGDEEDPGEWRTPRAVTLQSRTIEARITTCGYCQGIHHIQRCPSLRARLFAPELPWSDPALGKEIYKMFWRRHHVFVTLLRCLPYEHLLTYAASYQAFIRTYRPDTDLTISQVLAAWNKVIGPRPAAMLERAA